MNFFELVPKISQRWAVWREFLVWREDNLSKQISQEVTIEVHRGRAQLALMALMGVGGHPLHNPK